MKRSRPYTRDRAPSCLVREQGLKTPCGIRRA